MAAIRRDVLIVDDDEGTRLLVGRIVSQGLGARVTLAGTCEAALHSAESKAFHVILLDLVMPGIGGFDVLRQIRARGANRATPILVLSVMADHETRERCRLLGASAFLAKPVDRELLTTMLHSLLAPKPDASGDRAGASSGSGC